MTTQPRRYVAIDYTLTLDSGEVVDRSQPGEPLGFLEGASQIIAGLEKAVAGMAVGQSANVTVEPEEGYGLSKQDLFREIPRENFPDDVQLEPGMGFEAHGPHGPVLFRIQSVNQETVLADFNHPLAGQRLHFAVTVAEAREPRAEELASLMEKDGCAPEDCGSCGGGCGCGS